MSLSKKKSYYKGFTLIEVLAALFVFSVGMIAVVQLYSKLMLRVVDNKDSFTASALAQEGVELVTLIRNSNLIAGEDAFMGAGAPTRILHVSDDEDKNGRACHSAVEVGIYPYPLTCNVDPDPSNPAQFGRFRLSVDGAIFAYDASPSEPIYWRRIDVERLNQGTPGDTSDDALRIISRVIWDSESAGWMDESQCTRKNKCILVETTLHQW